VGDWQPFATAEPSAAVTPDPPPEQRRPTSLRDRVAGQCVISEVLAQQHGRPPRSALSRALGRRPIHSDARPWYWGALGEIAVGPRLTRLGKEWTVLHAVPVGERDADIDHVVIGPGGVFTINTKNHSGQRVWVAGRTFVVAGQKQDHIRSSRHEAQRASRLLSAAVSSPVPVQPVLAVVQPKQITVRDAPAEVAVMADAQLVRWLNKRKPVLAPDDVQRIAAAAEQPGSWRTGPVDVADTSALMAGFRRLDRQVRSARVVRQAWGLGVLAAGAVGMVTVGPEVLGAAALEGLLPADDPGVPGGQR
jgi:hypothetical protein